MRLFSPPATLDPIQPADRRETENNEESGKSKDRENIACVQTNLGSIQAGENDERGVKQNSLLQQNNWGRGQLVESRVFLYEDVSQNCSYSCSLPQDVIQKYFEPSWHGEMAVWIDVPAAGVQASSAFVVGIRTAPRLSCNGDIERAKTLYLRAVIVQIVA